MNETTESIILVHTLLSTKQNKSEYKGILYPMLMIRNFTTNDLTIDGILNVKSVSSNPLVPPNFYLLEDLSKGPCKLLEFGFQSCYLFFVVSFDCYIS
jgi:hypothetical protein